MQRWKVSLTIEATVWVDDPDDELSGDNVGRLAKNLIDLYQPREETVELELEHVWIEDMVKCCATMRALR